MVLLLYCIFIFFQLPIVRSETRKSVSIDVPTTYSLSRDDLQIKFDSKNFAEGDKIDIKIMKKTGNIYKPLFVRTVLATESQIKVPCGSLELPGLMHVCWAPHEDESVPSCEANFTANRVSSVISIPYSWSKTDLLLDYAPRLCIPKDINVTTQINLMNSYGFKPLGKTFETDVYDPAHGTFKISKCLFAYLDEKVRVTLQAKQYKDPIAASAWFDVPWTIPSPVLVMPETSVQVMIKNCEDIHGIKIAIEQVHCFKNDTVRLYGTIDGHQKLDGDAEFLKEVQMHPEPHRRTTLTGNLPCSSFLRKAFAAYCFVHASIDSLGRLIVHQQKCLSYTSDSQPNWSEWSPWGACSSQCGAGIRHRWRKCDNRRNRNYQCTGQFREQSTCQAHGCYDSPTSPEKRLEKDWLLQNDCSCGCIVKRPSILTISFSCEKNFSVWIFGSNNYHVSLRIIDFDWSIKTDSNHIEKPELFIRNGKQPFDDLIFHQKLTQDLKLSKSRAFYSSWNFLRLEFHRRDHNFSGSWNGLVLENSYLTKTEYNRLHGILDLEHPRHSYWAYFLTIITSSVVGMLCILLLTAIFCRYTIRCSMMKANIVMTQSMQTSASSGEGAYDAYGVISNRLSMGSNELSLRDFAGSTGDSSEVATPLTQRETVDFDSPKVPVKHSPGMYQNGRGGSHSSVLHRRTMLQGIPEVPEEGRTLKRLSKEICINLDSLQSEVTSSPSFNRHGRSIGIQLNSPAVRRGGHLSTGSSMASLPSVSGRGSPELEYDYYDAPVIGSFLNPVEEELNIDDILADCELLNGNQTILSTQPPTSTIRRGRAAV